MYGGTEWMVDAHGCAPARLRDRALVVALLDRIVVQMQLRVVATAIHVFPDPGGVTALYLLAESHLAIHTFPESGTATLNVYCCMPRTPPSWEVLLRETLDAHAVHASEHPRGQAR
jgi:S-adenosylmethionine decarboxylase